MPELPKIYQPENYEDKIYRSWEKSGYFNPDKLPGKRTKKYSVAMPPPNVTGVLHLGHALENALMDIAVRYHRLKGEKTVLIPGTDHAAVATQARVEKELIKNRGLKDPRAELGREKLLQIIREYAENSKQTILKQIRKLGTSCDWSRLAYTFDEARSMAVNQAFVKMYRDGLIYRGFRAINWSVKGQSTCSDDELVHEARTAKLYTFKYAANFPIAIATTRPETKLGDTAVAVHPDDQRYRSYIGKTYSANIGADQPLKIKVIADQSIDPGFGTGAMGVTPAHSLADYDLYLKHKLELVQVIGSDGRMTKQAGSAYAGLTAEQARAKFVSWLKDNHLLIKEEEVEQNVGTSDRFGDVVEVLPMTQWFVAVDKKIPGRNKTLKQLMRQAIGSGFGKIKITPDRFQKTYFQWIDNLRDWCISRQIWWGHQIPVWYQGDKIHVGLKTPQGQGWVQDDDTLDTWFSSSLWTFSTLGWPAKTKDFKEFHPTSWMQMGYEILFFWMARMILMSSYLLKALPFKEVYIHGILRNKDGQKFSKSLGTGIDPLEVIKTYGSDALRLSMIMGITPGNDARFYYEKVEGARNFVNKLWNISRYIISKSQNPNFKTQKNHLSSEARESKGDKSQITKSKTLADNWILAEFDGLVNNISKALDNYSFSRASELLYEFTWSKLADWYLEIAKIEGNKEEILLAILEKLLILWHPFCPFVTEAIWQELGKKSLLMVEKWPKSSSAKIASATRDFALIQQAVTVIRNIKSERQISPKEILNCSVKTSAQAIKENLPLLAGLAGVKVVAQTSGVKLNAPKVEITLAVKENSDLAKKRAAEIVNLQKYIEVQKKKLANQDFVGKAPEQVINKEKEKLREAEEKLQKLT